MWAYGYEYEGHGPAHVGPISSVVPPPYPPSSIPPSHTHTFFSFN